MLRPERKNARESLPGRLILSLDYSSAKYLMVRTIWLV